ncbi:MAG: imelysin family protein [Tabrizicola sp.]|nr:imelysin family protein [Tabrizicola sp.]
MRALLLALLLTTPAAADTAEAVHDQIRPGYAAFAEAAQALAALDSCDPDQLRPAFHAAYDAWLSVGHLHLGPAEDEGRSLAIHFWPDPKGLGRKAQSALLTGDPAALQPQAFRQQSVAARGLPALERLLYPAEPLPADACPLIKATAADLSDMTGDLASAWGPFGDLLLTAGEPGNTSFLSAAEARQALFTQFAGGLEHIADNRLGRPLGTFDKPRPELAEARASERSLRNVTLSLKALRSLALALNPTIPKTEATFDQAIALADTLDDPTLAGVADPQTRLKVEILQQAVRATRQAAIAELAAALGVTLGFNSQDGD